MRIPRNPRNPRPIERGHLRFWPRSLTQYETERLPPLESMADMRLRARAAEGAAGSFVDALQSVPGAVLAWWVAWMFAAPWLDPIQLLALGFAVSLGVVFYHVFLSGTEFSTALSRAVFLFLMPLAFALLKTASPRNLLAAVAGILYLAVAVLMAPQMLAFYRDWLLASPRVRIETERQTRSRLRGIDWPVLGGAFCLLAVVPLFSPFYGLLAVLAYLVLAVAFRCGPLAVSRPSRPGFRALFRMGIRVWEEYAHFQSEIAGAPGVWSPAVPLLRRRWIFRMLYLPLVFLVMAALHGPMPWDFGPIHREFQRVFAVRILPDPGRLAFMREIAPSVHWEHLAPPGGRPPKPSLEEAYRGEPGSEEFDRAQMEYRLALARMNDYEARARLALQDALGGSPLTWVYLAFHGLLMRRFVLLPPVLLALPLALAIAMLLLLLSFRRGLTDLILLEAELEAEAAADTRTLWQCYVDRLRSSPHVARTEEQALHEARHLFMGFEAYHRFPILLDQAILNDHVHITGGSGSGKTSLGVLPLLLQVIQGYPLGPEEAKAAGTKDGRSPIPPMAIIDLKGEYSLLHAVMDAVGRKARSQGRTMSDCFRLVSTDLDRPGHRFNPFQGLFDGSNPVLSACAFFLEALELNHGPGYGRQYFTKQSLRLLAEILKRFRPQSFDEIYQAILRTKTKKDIQNALELVATIEGLLEYSQLLTPPGTPPENLTILSDVIEKGQVVYVWAPVAEEGIAARNIANLFLFSFWRALRQHRHLRTGQRAQSYLFIDEFQEIIGSTFQAAINEARSSGLSFILSNQTSESLRLNDARNLARIVAESTRVKLMFSVDDVAEKRRICENSGMAAAYFRSGVYENFFGPEVPMYNAWRHELVTKLTIDDINAINDHSRRYLLHVRTSSGYTQFGGTYVPVETLHPISRKTFDMWDTSAPWPSAADLGISPESAAAVSMPAAGGAAGADEAIRRRIRGLIRKYPELGS